MLLTCKPAGCQTRHNPELIDETAYCGVALMERSSHVKLVAHATRGDCAAWRHDKADGFGAATEI